MSRVACETLLTTGLVVVAGEVTTSTYVDIPTLVRNTVCDIGYDNDAFGFNGRTCGVMVALDEQSPDIAQGVDSAFELRTGSGGEDLLNAQGAGDQGMMFGYACDETPDLMPLPIWLSHRLAQRLAQVRRVGVLPYLRPDGKTQVSVIYEDGRPVSIDTILISTQHQPGIDLETLLLPDLREHVIHPLLPTDLDTSSLRILANPTGQFELGGPHADTGLTGRKIIVDTYAAWPATVVAPSPARTPPRWTVRPPTRALVAKHVVASGAASRCEVQVAYAIGVARPVSVLVETFGTETVAPERIAGVVAELFDLRPAAIIRTSTCAVPSTGARRPTAISAARTRTSPGRPPLGWTTCAGPSGSEPGRRCVGSKCGGAARA